MVFQYPYGSLNPRQTLGSALDEALATHYRHSTAWRRSLAQSLLEQVGLEGRYINASRHWM